MELKIRKYHKSIVIFISTAHCTTTNHIIFHWWSLTFKHSTIKIYAAIKLAMNCQSRTILHNTYDGMMYETYLISSAKSLLLLFHFFLLPNEKEKNHKIVPHGPRSALLKRCLSLFCSFHEYLMAIDGYECANTVGRTRRPQSPIYSEVTNINGRATNDYIRLKGLRSKSLLSSPG